MPDVDNAIEWDFLTLVDWWNVYGLPVLLSVVAIAVLVRARSRPGATGWYDGSRTVLLVGLIHWALTLQADIALAQELLTLRVMGIPQSFVTPIGALFSALINPILAVGLLRRRRWARRFAMVWYAFLSAIAILVVSWLCYYHVGIDLAAWPEQVLSKVLPAFLFAVMLFPRIKRVFAAQALPEPLNAPASSHEGVSLRAGAPAGWPVLSVLTLLFLIVACSNLVVNAADWGYRLMFDSESLP